MSAVALVSVLQVISLAGSALTAGKLYATGLRRIYPVFFLYFIFRVCNSIWPLVLGTKHVHYVSIWICTEPIGWIFTILVVRELYRLIFSRLKGLYTAGRWAMYIGSAISIGISVLSLMHKIVPQSRQASKGIPYILAIDRGVDLSLAIFILLMLLFLSLYPAPLRRNLIIHATLFSIFFISNSLGVLIRAVFGNRINNETNLFMMGVSAVCTLAWFFLLTPRGEEARVSLPWLGPEDESRLLVQLDALNSTLLKVSRN
jgi:hypothetical protein